MYHPIGRYDVSPQRKSLETTDQPGLTLITTVYRLTGGYFTVVEFCRTELGLAAPTAVSTILYKLYR